MKCFLVGGDPEKESRVGVGGEAVETNADFERARKDPLTIVEMYKDTPIPATEADLLDESITAGFQYLIIMRMLLAHLAELERAGKQAPTEDESQAFVLELLNLFSQPTTDGSGNPPTGILRGALRAFIREGDARAEDKQTLESFARGELDMTPQQCTDFLKRVAGDEANKSLHPTSAH
jgi:hypothetical protein